VQSPVAGAEFKKAETALWLSRARSAVRLQDGVSVSEATCGDGDDLLLFSTMFKDDAKN
jgi:hypothetical protein